MLRVPDVWRRFTITSSQLARLLVLVESNSRTPRERPTSAAASQQPAH
jgi:hypothetical protein